VEGDTLKFEVKQVESVGHPMPGLVSVERSADIWRQFRQTLPFLPASKDFFEEVLYLSGQEQRKRAYSTPQTTALVRYLEAKQTLVEVTGKEMGEDASGTYASLPYTLLETVISGGL
jgi:hypothetical protein